MSDQLGRLQQLTGMLAATDLRMLQIISARGSMQFVAFDRAGSQMGTPGGYELLQVLQQVDSRLRAAGDDRPLVAELRIGDSGEVEFRHTFELDSVSPARLVLDAAYRHPHHPWPGMRAPAGVAFTDRPTNPAVLETVGKLVDDFVALYTSIKGIAPNFGAGYSEGEILAAETAIGMRLPEEVRALYRTVHDDLAEQGLLGAQSLMPLDAVVSEYLEGVPGSYGWDDDLFAVNPVVFEAYPSGRIRRVSRSDFWVTIASDRSMDWCAVDLDPAPLGTVGQLLEYGRNIIGPVGYVAESVAVVMRQVVDALRAGAYNDEDPDSPYLTTTPRIGAADPAPYKQVHTVHDRSVAATVAELEAALDVQELYLNAGAVINLAELAPLHNLRVVSVNRAGTARLALPHHVPTEALSVDATAVDLAPLAGHPTLWKLTLKGLAAPVTIEPLTTLPALAHLDLSAVEVTDLARVAALPHLKVLELNTKQWQYLRDHNAVPTTLAAAVLGENTQLAEAIDWATWLRNLCSAAM